MDLFIPTVISLLQTDLYKFTMLQFFLHRFPSLWTRYEFKCRTKFDLIPLQAKIDRQLDALCELRFTENELSYLRGIRFFSADFIEYLRGFKLERKYIKTHIVNGELKITAEGPLVCVSMFEVFVLTIVQKAYTSANFPDENFEEALFRLDKKITESKAYDNQMKFQFADFGTRRAFCPKWHDRVVGELVNKLSNRIFVGTSNVYLAMKYNIKCIGTMAHEALQLGQALVHPMAGQKYILEQWAQEYRGDLGIALSDIFGFDYFLNDFDRYLAKLYDGARHDSGDPFEWGEKLIAHYQKLGIDPLTKTAVFSDGLDFELAFRISSYFNTRIKVSPCIGTNLTFDTGHMPLQIVMKLVEVNGLPVAKISDSDGKGMCEVPEYETWLKSQIKKTLTQRKDA